MKVRIKIYDMLMFMSLMVLVSEKVIYHSDSFLKYIYYIVAFLIFLYSVFRYSRCILKNSLICIVILSQYWRLISNIINGADLLSIFRVLDTISLCMMVYYNLNKTKMKKKFLCIFTDALFIISVLDQILVAFDIFILGKNNIGGYGIFLHKNAHTIIYISAILFQKYKYYLLNRKLPRWFYSYIIICFIYASVILRSGSSSIAMLLLIFLTIFYEKFKSNIYNLLTVIIANIFIFIFIVVKRMDSVLLYFLVENILGKNLTFSGRSYMWESALRKLQDLPLFGYGDNISVMYMFQNVLHNNDCHNYILHTVLSGGWFYLLLVLIIYLICYCKMRLFSHTEESELVLFYLTLSSVIGINEIMISMSNLIFPILIMGISIKEWGINANCEREKIQIYEIKRI